MALLLDGEIEAVVVQAWEAQRGWEAGLEGRPRYDEATRLRAVCQRTCLAMGNEAQVSAGARDFPPWVQTAVSEGRPPWAHSPVK